MDLSDQYELMPIYFQKVIPKSHPKLKQMMSFHNEVIEEGTRTSANASEYAIERAIKNEMPINPSLKNALKHRIKCKICHL